MGVAGMLMAPAGVLAAQHLPSRPLLAIFALVLVFSAWRILKRPTAVDEAEALVPCRVEDEQHQLTWTRPCARVLAGTGMLAGFLSGLLGVGGGFVIIPALVRHTNLTLRSVQATSLAVIALVSASGVSAAAWQGVVMWRVALPFTAGALLALWFGQQLARRLDARVLHKAFAWFSLSVALLVLARALGLALI
jgi:uncharacterized membrane protein YfcA